jgi:hypothetical protein
MKLLNTLFLFIFLSLAFQTCFAQTLSYEDFKTLVPSLKKEAWAAAYQESQVFLDNAPHSK